MIEAATFSDALHLAILVLLLAALLVARRRGGRKVSRAAKIGAVVILVWGGIGILIVMAWPLILGMAVAPASAAP